MIRIGGAALAAAFFVGWIAHSSTAGTIAFFIFFVLIAAANVGKLRCPACRKRVKLGASRCHHCGQDVKALVSRSR